jgi:hypothetical protein
MRFPESPEVRYLPALSAGPLQGRTERGRRGGCGHSASLPDGVIDRSDGEDVHETFHALAGERCVTSLLEQLEIVLLSRKFAA